MVVVWILVLLLVDELGVDFQIAYQGMALGKSKVTLHGLFADEPLDVFESSGAAFKRLAAGCVQGECRVFFNQPAQCHDGTQRLWAACIDCRLRPLTTLIAQHGGAVHPVFA